MKRKVSKSISKRKLRLSSKKKWLGVCGGIAEYVGMDVTAIRVVFVVFTVFSGIFPGLLAYILVAWVMSEVSS